jgi:hypothetical protein
MAKESIYSIGKEPIFRETFNDQQTVERNGNFVYTPDVNSFNEGRCYLDGFSTNVDILTPISNSQTYSFRIKCKINDITPVSTRYICDYRKSNPTYLSFSSSGTLGSAGATVSTIYINANATNDLTGFEGEWIEIIYSALNSVYQLLVGTVGRFYNGTTNSPIDFELFEIYEGELTAEEVSNLYNNSRYRELNAVPVLNLTAEGGIIEDKAGNSFTNTDVEVVRDGQIDKMRFNGSSSFLDLGNPADLNFSDPFHHTFIAWIKANNIGTNDSFLSNSSSGSASDIRFEWQYHTNKMALVIGNGTVFERIYANNKITDKLWYNIALTINGSVVKFYMDGERDGIDGTLSYSIASLITTWKIGNAYSNSVYSYDGTINNILVYNNVLTDQMVSQYYSSTKFKYKG